MNRRQVLLTGGSVVALVLAPAVVVAAPTAPFVPPTTNIVHLAGRISHNYGFKRSGVLRLLGLDSSKMPAGDEPARQGAYYYDPYERIRSHVDVARVQAESGDHDVYERARCLIKIKRKLNTHFNFDAETEREWLDTPNPHLKGLTFREVMVRDLRLAAEVIGQVLAD